MDATFNVITGWPNSKLEWQTIWVFYRKLPWFWVRLRQIRAIYALAMRKEWKSAWALSLYYPFKVFSGGEFATPGLFCVCSTHFPPLPLIIVCVVIVSNSTLNCFCVDQRNICQMLRCFVPIATSIFSFCFRTIRRTKSFLYNSVFAAFYNHNWLVACKHRLLTSSAFWEYELKLFIPGLKSLPHTYCVSRQPPDQVPAVQHHWWRRPGGFWKRPGQSVEPGWLQRHGVYQRRPVHCGHGQHQGDSLDYIIDHTLIIFQPLILLFMVAMIS